MCPKSYNKPPLSFDEQANKLKNKGLVDNKDYLISKLQFVNYARLKKYWYHFVDYNDPEKRFNSGTSIDDIWHLYRLDRFLRLNLFDAVERIEVALKTHVVNAHTLKFDDAFSVYDKEAFPNMGKHNLAGSENHKPKTYARFLKNVNFQISREKHDISLQNYRRDYGQDAKVPFWISCEFLDFSSMLWAFRGMDSSLKQEIASLFNPTTELITEIFEFNNKKFTEQDIINSVKVTDKVFDSWMFTLQYIRNICAHHARLWDINLKRQMLIPRKKKSQKYNLWRSHYQIDPQKIFSVLTIVCYLMKVIVPGSKWKSRTKKVILDFSDSKLDVKKIMGFPEGWEDSPIWA